MTTATALPDVYTVGYRAGEILDLVRGSAEYARLEESTRMHPDCWSSFIGYPVIARLDLDRDAGPLFVEALRVLALTAAVFELTGGDENAADLVVSIPVDEMVHAVLAQYTLCQNMTARLGIRFVHMTDRFGWDRGDYTHQCYVAAGWGEPDPRYWIDTLETARRTLILQSRYERIGIRDCGRRHDIDFEHAPKLLTAR